jgi:hypothetical protein
MPRGRRAQCGISRRREHGNASRPGFRTACARCYTTSAIGFGPAASGEAPPMPPTSRMDQLQHLHLAERRAVSCREVRSLALLRHGRCCPSPAMTASAPANGRPTNPTSRRGAPRPTEASWVRRARQPGLVGATLQRPKPEPGRCSTTGPFQQGGGSGAWQLLSPNAATTRPPMTGGAPSGTTVTVPVKKTPEKRLHRYDPAAILARS